MFVRMDESGGCKQCMAVRFVGLTFQVWQTGMFESIILLRDKKRCMVKESYIRQDKLHAHVSHSLPKRGFSAS